MTQDELTYKVNGCSMKIHNTLGNGFQEVIYQRCLAVELDRAGIHYLREREQNIYYDGVYVGKRRVDFIIENLIIVELKAVFSLLDEHLSQTKNYLVAYDKPIGLLINFGSNSLQFKKVFNPRYHDKKLYNETKKNKENNQRNERIKSISHILSSCNPEDPGHPDN